MCIFSREESIVSTLLPLHINFEKTLIIANAAWTLSPCYCQCATPLNQTIILINTVCLNYPTYHFSKAIKKKNCYSIQSQYEISTPHTHTQRILQSVFGTCTNDTSSLAAETIILFRCQNILFRMATNYNY